MREGLPSILAWIVGAVAGATVLAPLPCRRDAGALFEGDPATQERLARGVESWLDDDLDRRRFGTGSDRFDGEWRFGTYVMAALGYGQVAMEHPQGRAASLARMERCLDLALGEDVRAFDRDAWGADPLDAMGTERDHAAFLGYLDLALSLHRAIAPASRFAELNDDITTHLAQRMSASPIGLLETYPGEVYPVDNAAFVGALGLRAREDPSLRPLLRRALARVDGARDPVTGLLFQAVSSTTGEPVDSARGSGTALAVYFLSFADAETSRSLYDAAQARLSASWLGFGALREHPRGAAGGADVDSGPVVLGLGLSATGFAIAGARAHGDRAGFTSRYATAHLFGAPVDRGGRRNFAMGGPLGDALMFAMTTAQATHTWAPSEGEAGS